MNVVNENNDAGAYVIMAIYFAYLAYQMFWVHTAILRHNKKVIRERSKRAATINSVDKND